jgi:hypothetical protein
MRGYRVCKVVDQNIRRARGGGDGEYGRCGGPQDEGAAGFASVHGISPFCGTVLI